MIINLQNIKKVYINLDKDIERKAKFEQSISILGYNNVERFSARLLPKKKDFNHGCSQSHHDLMIQYKNNLPLFILEDDAKPTIWYGEYVQNGMIEIPEDSDVIYIGFSTAGCWRNCGVNFYAEHYNDKWMKLKHCLGTHAIIFLNNNAIQKFIENSRHTIDRKIPLDIGYAKDVLPKLNVYAPTKSLFYQWDKCWITTNTTVDTKQKEWTSFKEDGSLNFKRIYTNA
jgi:hypothetical protein